MLGSPLYLDAPHVWTTPVCMNAPYVWMSSCMFGCPLYVWKMFGCPLYIHNTKKPCFVRLMGCPYAPNTFRCPHMFGCTPMCLDDPLYVWMPLYVLMPPTCLHVPHIFGCPQYIHNTKTECFVTLQGCPYAPIHLDAHHMFGHPPVCLDAPYVWMPSCMF